MYLQGIVIFFCLAFVSNSFCYDDTDNEADDRRVFDEITEEILTGSEADSTLRYEVIAINLYERLDNGSSFGSSGIRMQIRALGEDIDMYLHATDSILFDDQTPVYYAKRGPGRAENVDFVVQRNAMRNVGRLLENPTELASVVIGTGKYQGRILHGHLRKRGMIVRSLPQNVIDKYVRKQRRRRSIDGQDVPSNLNYHLVYKVDKPVDAIEESPVVVLRKSRDIRGNSSSDIPDTLYLRVLVVVENDMYNSLMRKYINLNGILKYQMAFWNGVDLTYRSLKTPNIRLNIVGIIFESEPQALSYIRKYNDEDKSSIQIIPTMALARKFFVHISNSFSLDVYDVAVTLTTRSIDHGSYIGWANIMSVCKLGSSPTETRAVALLMDNTAFSGVNTAAHELGHSLGIRHDGNKNNCSDASGYLMQGTSSVTMTSSLFSRCSLERFNFLLENGYLKCLYTPPRRYGKDLPKLLPGRLAGVVDDQCQSLGHLKGCLPDEHDPYREDYNICVHRWCVQTNGACWVSTAATLDGSPCTIKNEAEPGFCLRGKCVRLTNSSGSSYSRRYEYDDRLKIKSRTSVL